MTTNTVYLKWLPVQLASFLVKATAFSVKHPLQPDVADHCHRNCFFGKDARLSVFKAHAPSMTLAVENDALDPIFHRPKTRNCHKPGI